MQTSLETKADSLLLVTSTSSYATMFFTFASSNHLRSQWHLKASRSICRDLTGTMYLLTFALVSLSLLRKAVAIPSAENVTISSRVPSGSKSVIIQMFEWSWDSVASECTNFIGPAGYGFVQVSPPAEHVQGSQWWTDYQPVSYTLTSKRGNRQQFQNMVSACHAAGVKVIADTILNHMAGSDSGTGVAGSSFTHYNYPGIYQNQDFHHCGLESGDEIVNYGNRVEVQTCELVNLADLATDTEYVRGRLAAYINDLLSLGVDGLRLDAAKHIASTDLANILSRLNSKPYITQEVIFGNGEPIQPSEYVGNGDVQEFRYTTTLKSTFLGGGISSLQNLDNRGWVSGSQANVFVTNHDTERNGDSLNSNSPSNTYVTATIFSLAHPYGTPTVLSSYSFSNIDDGSPNGGAGTCTATGGSNGWLCQHRWTAISGMVGFRNTVGSAAINNWVSPQSQQIAFGRGSAGFVAINNADSTWSASFSTSLADGSYCDVISGRSSDGACTGVGVTVSGGIFNANVPPRSAIAIHTGQKGTGGSTGGGGGGSGTVAVTFIETATTTFGENIFLVGSVTQLGNWAPASAIALSSANYPQWSVTVNLPANTAIEYKFIRKETDGSVVWESDPNRQVTTAASGSQTLNSSWK
ncbi:alpha-amylase [Moniliophthora roreri MCA 2997]|uniref:Alpha-amylase n=1 Tax=Moniliophthora roreri (strain MCA 2997) TaxID=1381753 RepID=V2XLX9_MONRO|nr:alpha-amylase [Moniliophthora roreri MCA 2997]